MTQNKIHPDLLGLGPQVRHRQHPNAASTASWVARLSARIFADRLDREVETGVTALPGSALAVHVARLTSTREREQLARGLRSALREANDAGGPISSRMPVSRAGLRAVADLVDEVTLRLHAPSPVRARGTARLRMLLGDGTGPLYHAGRGSLPAELRGVLAAL